MTDEEKKEYRDKLVEDCMKYNHIDYDDDCIHLFQLAAHIVKKFGNSLACCT